jgi:hypothetical protein
MIPNEFLSTLWNLWKHEIISPAQVIKALNLYGYQLDYIGNGGLKASKERETYRYEVA